MLGKAAEDETHSASARPAVQAIRAHDGRPPLASRCALQSNNEFMVRSLLFAHVGLRMTALSPGGGRAQRTAARRLSKTASPPPSNSRAQRPLSSNDRGARTVGRRLPKAPRYCKRPATARGQAGQRARARCPRQALDGNESAQSLSANQRGRTAYTILPTNQRLFAPLSKSRGGVSNMAPLSQTILIHLKDGLTYRLPAQSVICLRTMPRVAQLFALVAKNIR